jgi:hypothetical protein
MAPESTSGLLLGIGKWDRFMTPGPKVQDGTDFDFSSETFGQIVRNFSRVYSERRLPLDFRHNAIRDSDLPEQNLAYYDSLASVIGGKVEAFWSQDPSVAAPNPTELLAGLQAKFPRVTSCDGLWGRKCEITPMGEACLPNMEQLSPLFSKDDQDEAGNPIGYNLLNVSAVGIAFQNGTLLNLSKRLGKIKMNEQKQKELLAKLAKHGLEDQSDSEQLRKALAAYMAETEDGPSDRKEMASCMGELLIKHEDQAEPSFTDEKAMSKKLRKDSDSDPATQKLVAELTGKMGSMSKQLAAFEAAEQKRSQAEFYKQAERHTTRKDADEYVALCDGDLSKALKLIQKLPVKGSGVMGRVQIGGSESNAPAETTKVVNGGTVVLHGFGLSAMAKKVAAERKITIGEAQLAVVRENPSLYQRGIVQ